MGLRRNKKLKTRLAGSQPVRVAGSRPQGPVGQVSRGLGARGPQGLGPASPGTWGLFPKPLKLRFFANLLVGAWRRRGCRLKRLLRRWGPGGNPPYPSPPSATIQHAPQGRRIEKVKGPSIHHSRTSPKNCTLLAIPQIQVLYSTVGRLST